MTERAFTYRDAGVDIDRTDQFVRDLPGYLDPTRSGRVLSDLCGFAAQYLLEVAGMAEPVLVTTTDGVGTKLVVAQLMGRHDTIGVDLVAMCVNDLVTCGARPLVFLDYMAMGRFDGTLARELIRGMVEGCRQAGASLVGGETAEMPGFYPDGRYELAGFAVGIVDRPRRIDPGRIADGHLVIGFPSSGLHSNGYSLARRLLLPRDGDSLADPTDRQGQTMGELLLTPTRIYVDLVTDLIAGHPVHGIAHITGGGLVDNLARLLPAGLAIDLTAGSWEVPWVFHELRRRGGLDRDALHRTFNMGIGLAVVVPPDAGPGVLERRPEARVIGRVRPGGGEIRVG